MRNKINCVKYYGTDGVLFLSKDLEYWNSSDPNFVESLIIYVVAGNNTTIILTS